MAICIRVVVILCALFSFSGCQYGPTFKLFNFGPNDTQISAAVHRALDSKPELKFFTFHIETADGVVYLSGYVKTIRQSDVAEQTAREVTGVRSVENNIIVRK